MRTDNPAARIKTQPVRRMERFLSDLELARLDKALTAEIERGGNVYAVAALRLLALTGCRRSEIVGLRWQDVDIDRQMLRLPDSKTREKTIHLNPAAVQILRTLPRVHGHPHVIVGTKPGQPYTSLDKVWARVTMDADLQGVRIHDLRHTYASVGAAGGVGLQIVGKLLGHRQASTTARYSHLADDPLRRAANAIGMRIAAAMGSKKEVATS